MEVLPQKGDFFRFTGATLASEPLFRYTSIAVDHLQEYEVYIMKYQIKDGTVTLGGETILSHIDFEIQGNQKIAVVGRNGAGKTTLLRLIAGELSLDRDDRRQGPGILASRQLTVEMLGQQALAEEERTVEELMMLHCPAKGLFDRERFEYEREYDTLFTGLGFQKEDKKRSVAAFSGGQKTKIALIRLLLQKPDLLLLDEPTNHLDMETACWLEGYLKQYQGAVVMVSHDRFLWTVLRILFMSWIRGRSPGIREIIPSIVNRNVKTMRSR